VKVAVTDVQLKQGLFGIKVRILPPNINFVDKPTMKIVAAAVTQPVITEVPVPAPAAPEVEPDKEEATVGNPTQA